MKLTSNLAVIVAAAFLPLLPASKAATTLTGLQVISTDPSGNADLQSPQAWNTRNTSGRTKLWIINGDIDKPFLNGPTHLEAGIDIPMRRGDGRAGDQTARCGILARAPRKAKRRWRHSER